MNWRGELLLLRRDPAVVTAGVLFACLSGFALANGIRWREGKTGEQTRAAQTEQVEYAKRRATVVDYQIHPPPPLDSVLLNLFDPSSPYIVGQAGRTAALPLPPIAATAVGQFDFLALQELVSIRTRQRTVADKDGLENPLQLMTGRFDLAFNVVYLLPLFLLALTYNLVSLEREQGTLGLLRAQPIVLSRLLGSKAVLRAAVLLLVCCLMILPFLFSGDFLRAAFWLVIVAAYAAFWVGLSLWVGSFGKDSTTNATILTICWLAFVAVIPALLQLAVAAIEPPPSRLKLLAAVREQSIDQRRDGKQLAVAWYAEHPEMLPPGQTTAVYDTPTAGTMTHIEQDRRTLPLEAEFDRRLSSRQDLIAALRFLSPSIVTSEALQDCAGTSVARHRRFKAQAKTFREEWLRWFHPRIFRKAVLRPSDYDHLPVFTYQEEPSPAWMGRAGAGALAIALMASALAWMATRRFRRA